jgi:heptaprenyl diphosphate synthase
MTDFWEGIPSLSGDLEAVTSIIHDNIQYRSRAVTEGLHDLVGGNGKMLRPALLVMASRFGRFQADKVYQLAAALEMLHVATLIHDDVIDDSPMRRGRSTLHTRYGLKDSVLAGDLLFSRCFLLSARFTTPENARLLAQVIETICSSEIEQDEERFHPSASRRSCLHRITGKTALLFSLACHVGASESGCNTETTESLRRVGYNIGIAFQIMDDILDYEGSVEVLRKPVGHDIREGLCTLPMVLALARDDGRLLDRLQFVSNTDGEVAEVIALVKERGGLDAARVEAAGFTGRALAGIARLKPSSNRDNLRTLTEKLLARRY